MASNGNHGYTYNHTSYTNSDNNINNINNNLNHHLNDNNISHSSDDDEDDEMLSHEDMNPNSYTPYQHQHQDMHMQQQQQQPQQQQQQQQQAYHDTSSNANDLDAAAAAADKVRKRPGRKPNPTSPTIRKEQNRAAQRAFRDRKERHLQQLENMIKDLKDQHFLVTSKYQHEARQLKAHIEALQSENYYLREVVFAFEIALSKAKLLAVLKDVKEELFRRHYEKHSGNRSTSVSSTASEGGHVARNIMGVTSHVESDGQLNNTHPQSHASQSPAAQESDRSSREPSFGGGGAGGRGGGPQSAMSQTPPPSLPHRQTKNMPANVESSHSRQTTPQSTSGSPSAHRFGSSHMSLSPSPLSSRPQQQDLSAHQHQHQDQHQHSSNMNEDYSEHDTLIKGEPEPIHTIPHPLSLSILKEEGSSAESTNNREILYKAPPLFISMDSDEPVARSPFEPLSAPKPAYTGPGTVLGKNTDYTKHPSVFDELQSSLFPPGTLTSMHIDMDTPQEVINDSSLFEEPHVEGGAMGGSSLFLGQGDKDKAGSGSSGSGTTTASWVRSTTRFPEGFLGPHRLEREFKIMASASPATDPDIDPQVYEIPHDPRIDIVACPKMRAQMILKQGKYDLDELFHLVVRDAICHGSPTDPSAWQMGDEFYDRFSFLAGTEVERLRKKVWPKQEMD
ncbi:hypothetical protein BGZ94_002804 [Podila epigama]|nr:hypothetical protein BGZ94_002804 [Podila epigama]